MTAYSIVSSSPLVPAAPSRPCESTREAVRNLRLRASVERAVSKVRARDALHAPESVSREERACRLEARALELSREEKWGAAARSMLRACHANPHSVRRWKQAARWQREDGDPFGAVETLRRALKYALRSDTQDGLRLTLAETLAECGEHEACARECRHLLDESPRHHAALELLASALLHQGRVTEAVERIRALLCLSPRDPMHRLKLGALLHLQGHLGQAVREFERVEVLSPSPEWAEEAREAIDTLDKLQIEAVMLCMLHPGAGGEEFRTLARRDLDTALSRHEFYLSDRGRETLRALMWEGKPSFESSTSLPRVH